MLLQRTVRSKISFSEIIEQLKAKIGPEYAKYIDEKQGALKELAKKLEVRLQEWTNPKVGVSMQWDYNDNYVDINEPGAKVAIKEDKFIGDIARFGHGLQRAFLLTLLQELAAKDLENAPTLILGIRNRNYQHPPQSLHMTRVLESISENNAQVLICTHSPYFVPSSGFEQIRMIRKDNLNFASHITSLTMAQLSDMLNKALGEMQSIPDSLLLKIEQIMQPPLREIYFSPMLILVEGIEDIAYISTYLHLMELWGDFRKYGCHFVACNGKNTLSRPLAIAQGLGIPLFLIFDTDCGKFKKDGEIRNNERDNNCLINLLNIKNKAAFDKNNFGVNWTTWLTNIHDEIKKDIGEKLWDTTSEQIKKKNNWQGIDKKNGILVGSYFAKFVE